MSTAVTIIDPTTVQLIPAPAGLPKHLADAYDRAMGEVVNLIDSPDVQSRFAHVMLTQLRTNRALQECSTNSIILGIVSMAEHGLDPSAPNEAFLIPYKGVAQMQVGYGGLVKLALSHPDVLDVYADEVCVNDTYEFYGVNVKPKHVYPGAFQPRGRYVGYYAVAHLTGHRWRAVQMSVDEIKAHAKFYSNNWDKKVYSEEPGGGFRGMSLKTVLRKICNTKYLPMSGKVATLLRNMDTFEGVIDAESQDIRDTARHQLEAGKTLADHIEDVTGRPPAPSGVTPTSTDSASTTVGSSGIALPTDFRQLRFSRKDLEGMDQDTFIGHMDTLLEAQGLTPQQRSAWKGKLNRKHKVKAFRDLPRDMLVDLYMAMQAKALTRETGHEAASTGEHAASGGDVTADTASTTTSQGEPSPEKPTPTALQTGEASDDTVPELPDTPATAAAPDEPPTDEPSAFRDDHPGDHEHDDVPVDLDSDDRHEDTSSQGVHGRHHEHVPLVATDFLASPGDLRLRTDLLTMAQELTSLFLREEVQALVEDASTPEAVLRQKFDEVAQMLDAEAEEQELPF